MQLTAIAPFVDEALWPSFDELVSVEKPESCTTLPLFSPLFGSFFPLWELLRLRVNEDEDNSPAIVVAAATTTDWDDVDDVDDDGCGWVTAADAVVLAFTAVTDVDGSFWIDLRLIRIPGSHSRLIKIISVVFDYL